MTPLKAIRAYCLECMGMNAAEVRLCPILDCPLYDYRLGHNPARKGQGRAVNFKNAHSMSENEGT